MCKMLSFRRENAKKYIRIGMILFNIVIWGSIFCLFLTVQNIPPNMKSLNIIYPLNSTLIGRLNILIRVSILERITETTVKFSKKDILS